MWQKVFYIMQPGDLAGQALPNGCVLLEAGSADGIIACYSIVSLMQQPFGFLLPQSALHQEIIEQMVPFFFLQHYQKAGGQPVIYTMQQKGMEIAVKEWICATEQGFIPVMKHVVSDQCCTSSEPEKIRQLYTALLHNRIPKLFIRMQKGHSLQAIIYLLQKEEQQFQLQYPVQYSMKMEIEQLKEKVHRLEQQLGAAQQEISFQNAHLQSLRSGTQAAQLQQFYNNEYEVLPRWYKQLGHLIKAVTGKRRFRSLFNKQEKKYNS